jgi:hypothetical protein
MNRIWIITFAGVLLLLSCQNTGTREVLAESPGLAQGGTFDDTGGPQAVSSAYVDAKTTFPQWPVPKTLRVVQVGIDDRRQMMEVAALQGLVNRYAPQDNMIFLEGRGFPDAFWAKYYADKLNLKVVPTSIQDLLDWVKQNTDIRYYIIIDPTNNLGDVNLNHVCTINIACTIAGIVGVAVPVSPGNVRVLESHGFSLLPDSYCDSLGSGGRKLRRPDAFDLRNQWKSAYGEAPWQTRRDAYKWALDVLLPLTDHHSITLNPGMERLNEKGEPAGTEPWITDYSIGARQFHFYFHPAPNPDKPQDRTNYDYLFYKRLLKECGPMTMQRGWHFDENPNLTLLSKMNCFNFGSRQQANASVHAALSPLFIEPFQQREIKPESVNLDPGKVYLTFSVTDGDQPGVVYRGWESNKLVTGRESLWEDPARGQIPINWTMNGLMYAFDRGIMRYYFDNASPKDYFTADLPVGYAFLTYDNFGPLLAKYDAFANRYLEKVGMPVAAYLPAYGSFQPIADSTVTIHIRELTHAKAIREGYMGSFYQGVYWPEERPLMPYIRNTISAGMGGYDNQKETAESVARSVAELTHKVPWRPLFVHMTWVNWFLSPSDMQTCLNGLEKTFPGQYELVGMPEFLALAQKAKMTGKYPLEFKAHRGGESGLEAPFLWQQKDTYTSGKEERQNTWRGVRGGGFITYKFNVAPARRASVSMDLSGNDFHVDASPDNKTWTKDVMRGSSSGPTTKTADLTPYLNSKGSVYLRISGDAKIYHAKVDYGP